MSEARDAILGTIRSALAGAGPDRLEAGALEHRLAEHRRNLEPARSDLDPGARVDLFIAEAERVDATVARVPSTADVPAAIAGYLANNNLPARLKVAPSADLEAIPWTAATTLEPAGVYWEGMGFIGIGAVAMTVLTWMKSRFLWWPLHPIGFPIMATRVTDQIWFSVMLAWLIKVLVLRYGGTPLFRRSRYFFLGMILGAVVVRGLWLVIDYFTGQVGNHVMRNI